jgi:VanZ family protein
MGKDKLYHLIAGFIIAFAISFWRPGEAIFVAMVAGVLKEVYDKYGRKTEADPLDAITTTVGGVIGAAVSILIQNALQ